MANCRNWAAVYDFLERNGVTNQDFNEHSRFQLLKVIAYDPKRKKQDLINTPQILLQLDKASE